MSLFKRIVVGTDGSESAREAIRQAASLAQMSGASLDVVSAYEPVASRSQKEPGAAPADVAHEFGPRKDVHFALDGAAAIAADHGGEPGVRGLRSARLRGLHPARSRRGAVAARRRGGVAPGADPEQPSGRGDVSPLCARFVQSKTRSASLKRSRKRMSLRRCSVGAIVNTFRTRPPASVWMTAC